MKYDRKLLEKAVEKYPKITNRKFVLASKLSKKQLSNAIKHIDKFAKPEEVVAFLDRTLFANGKDGILLTTEKIVSSDSATNGAYFEKFIRAEASVNELAVFYADNARRKIKIKTYAEEAASLLNTIVKLRDKAEKKEEPKSAERSKPAETAKPKPPKPAVKVEPPKLLTKTEPEISKPAPSAKEGTYAWYLKKALAGDVRSMLEIADICEKEGDYYSEEKFYEALFWNLRAAEAGSPWGAGNVGKMFENGIGVPANNEIALEWYQKSPFHRNVYDNLKIYIESGGQNAVSYRDEYNEFVQWAGDYGEILYENGMNFDERFKGYVLTYISAMLGCAKAQSLLEIICAENPDFGECSHKK